MSPHTLEAHGLASNQTDQTQAAMSDPQKKLSGKMPHMPYRRCAPITPQPHTVYRVQFH